MTARPLTRTLAAVVVGGAALAGTASPATGITDPVGDTITSQLHPADPSARPFADIVELDGAMYGSTAEVRVRVAGSGPPPAPFRAAFVTGEVGSQYPGVYVDISHGTGPTKYLVYAGRSNRTLCEGAASFDGVSTYTARFDIACIGSPHPISLDLTTYVDDPTPQSGSQWQDQVFDAVVHPTAVQTEPRPSWTAASATYAGTNRLRPGTALRLGQYLLADDVGTVLVLRRTGDLVLYGRGGLPRWSSGTGGQGVVSASMQPDGNLVLYRTDGRAVWSTGTFGHPGASLTVQRDGNAVIYGRGTGPLWSTGTFSPATLVPVGSDRLATGGRIRPGQYLRSADGRYAVVLRHDGDLVAYGPGHHALWATGTRGQPVLYATLQGDGNLVVYRTDGRPAWSSGTAGQPGRRLVVQADGNVVLYGPASRPLWWSGTQGRF
jgi:hypothetical protein